MTKEEIEKKIKEAGEQMEALAQLVAADIAKRKAALEKSANG